MKVILSIGFNDKDSKKQEVTTNYAMRIIEEVTSLYMEGYTLYATKGGYKHMNGDAVRENGARIELYNTTIGDVKPLIEELKNVLNQESLAVELVNDNTIFI